MHLEEYINSLLNRQESIGNAYFQRLLFTQSVVNRQNSGINRTVTLLYLLNDLGACRSESPFLLAEEVAAKARTEIPSTEMSVKALSSCDIFCRMRGTIGGASAFLEKNLEQVRKDSPEYMPEALAAAGYACYLGGQFSDAAAHLQEAVDRFYDIGEILGKKTATEILISALEKSGRTTEAQTITASYLTEFKEVTQ